MFIRIENVPTDITEEEVMELFNYSPRVKHVTIKVEPRADEAVILVLVNAESRAVLNGIADYMNGRYIRGAPIRVSAPLFFNDPEEQA